MVADQIGDGTVRGQVSILRGRGNVEWRDDAKRVN
jgi:hypothetical protein